MAQIILLERVDKLGRMGEVVTVKDGYARNFLLPHGKALRATKANIARFEAERAQIESRSADQRAAAESLAETLDGKQFIIIRQASEGGALYGSVTPRDIADAAGAEGFEVSRTQVRLEKPVKELGLHALTLVLHPEVSVGVKVNVARSKEEAEIQASGKSIAEIRAEEDQALEDEIAELFDEIGAAAADDDDPRDRGDDPRDAGDDPRDTDAPYDREARGDDPRD
ncbi:MAG: 50S ribosomal protein L9 [Pseudomonadota bacterium]